MDEPTAYYIEWSKSERERQHMLMHIYGIWKDGIYWWTHLLDSNGDTEVDGRCSGAGEVGTDWESSFETYTLPYVKHIVNRNLLYDTGSSNPVPCDN